MVHLARQRLRTAATKPRFRKRGTQRVVRTTVGCGIQRQLLTVAGRQWHPCILLEDILHTEVVELDSNLADEHSRTVATLQVQLARAALFHLVDNVHGAVFGIGTRLGNHRLLLEELKSQQLAAAAQDGVAAEEVSRTGVKLTHDDLVVSDGVAFNPHVADTGLLALHNAYLYVDAVTLHGHLHWSGAEEQVAVIHIQRRNVGT